MNEEAEGVEGLTTIQENTTAASVPAINASSDNIAGTQLPPAIKESVQKVIEASVSIIKNASSLASTTITPSSSPPQSSGLLKVVQSVIQNNTNVGAAGGGGAT